IRHKLNESNKIREVLIREEGPELPASGYHIGKTQVHPLDLGAFAQRSSTDHAAKDFTKNLKEHLLLRIHAGLKIATKNPESGASDAAQSAQTTVLIKDNRIFNHKLARFYHTTYDVRQSEDVINPRTPHCDIVLLSDTKSGDVNQPVAGSAHRFLYARVIGIYHVNVVYIGVGMTGYKPIRFDFLHVRWFQLDPTQARGSALRLDRVSFPPIAGKDAFSFLDPSLVLRGCHLIPAYSLKRRNLEGIQLSELSKDKNDWKSYYVNRFADRDMAVRYHWGLGIGHIYSHGGA
ncbi:hypothetical protein HYPSUDRAFT_125060, partial [Hypholoma sublateritium FD-334 SS-4]